MPLSPNKDNNLKPLEPLEIWVAVKRKGYTYVKLAQKWKTTPEIISRVATRREPFVYQPIREKLAKFIGCDVSQIGREPQVKEQTGTV